MNNISKELKALSRVFDAAYYDSGKANGKSNYHDYSWDRLSTYFRRTAGHIVDRFSPATALDVGCAKGFLVQSLVELGVDAKGVDASEYAVSQVAPHIAERVTQGLVQRLPYADKSFDVVTALDVLEHIPEKQIPKTLAELVRVSRGWIILRMPTVVEEGDLDQSHETIRPKEWWEEKLREAGCDVLDTAPYVDRGVWWFNIPDYLVIAKVI